jgi:hypothetical protein
MPRRPLICNHCARAIARDQAFRFEYWNGSDVVLAYLEPGDELEETHELVWLTAAFHARCYAELEAQPAEVGQYTGRCPNSNHELHARRPLDTCPVCGASIEMHLELEPIPA